MKFEKGTLKNRRKKKESPLRHCLSDPVDL
jgi:hypothetical protein